MERKVYSTDEKIENTKEFLRQENRSSPLLGFTLENPMHFIACRHAHNLLGNMDVGPEDIDIEGMLLDYEEQYEQNIGLPGNCIWTTAPLWTLPWLDVILGGRLAISENSSPYTYSTDVTLETGKTGKLYKDKNWLDKLLEYQKKIVESSSGRFPVAAPNLRGPSDLLQLFFKDSHRDIIFNVYDRFDFVKGLSEKLADFYIDVREKTFNITPLFHCGSVVVYKKIWMPGRSFFLQEDTAGSLFSPEIYKKLTFDDDKKIIARYPNLFYHLHSEAYKPILDSIIEIDQLKIIDIMIDFENTDFGLISMDFKKVIDANKSLYIYIDGPMELVEKCLKNLPYKGRGTFICLVVKDREEAFEYQDFIESYLNCKR